jgi:hypothetical protein
MRPGKDIHILADMVRPETEAPRTLWTSKVGSHSTRRRITLTPRSSPIIPSKIELPQLVQG